MGEIISDMVCKKIGINEKCKTADIKLENYRLFYKGGFHGKSN